MEDRGNQTSAWTLFFAALLLSAFREALQMVDQRLLISNPQGIPEGSGFLLKEFVLVSLLPFLVSPVLLFFVFYRLGRSVSLAERYRSVASSLFAGGLAGTASAFFILVVAFGSTWGPASPDLLSVVTTVATYLLALVGFGLSALFPGFVAIAIANLRKGEAPDAGHDAGS